MNQKAEVDPQVQPDSVSGTLALIATSLQAHDLKLIYSYVAMQQARHTITSNVI